MAKRNPEDLPERAAYSLDVNLAGIDYKVCTEELKGGLKAVADALRSGEIDAGQAADYIDQLNRAHTEATGNA